MTKTFVVLGEPDDVLLSAVRALRRMGAQITRYDRDDGTLEARTSRWRVVAVLRLRAIGDDSNQTRVEFASEALSRRRLFGFVTNIANIRRFLTELSRSAA